MKSNEDDWVPSENSKLKHLCSKNSVQRESEFSDSFCFCAFDLWNLKLTKDELQKSCNNKWMSLLCVCVYKMLSNCLDYNENIMIIRHLFRRVFRLYHLL